jgi:hypothetical protein
MKNSTLIYSAVSIGIVLAGVLFGGLIRDGYLEKVEYLVKNSVVEKLVGPLVSFGFMSEESVVIDHASVGFALDKFVVDPSPETGWTGDEYFANVVSQCVFHSEESFEPLCAICTLKDADGNVIGTGVVGETFDQNYVASSIVNIDIVPEIENPPSNDVQKVHDVKVEICKQVNGCTPGYWRQTQHFGSWIETIPPYSPIDPPPPPPTTFRAAFGLDDIVVPINPIIYNTIEIDTHPGGGPSFIISDTFADPNDDITLLDAIWAKGDDEGKLARHGTAALLNDAHPTIPFNAQLDEAEIIRLVQIAFGKINDSNGIYQAGDFNEIGTLFASANEAGGENHCPLGNNPLEAP